jgi:hypothetical protein
VLQDFKLPVGEGVKHPLPGITVHRGTLTLQLLRFSSIVGLIVPEGSSQHNVLETILAPFFWNGDIPPMRRIC